MSFDREWREIQERAARSAGAGPGLAARHDDLGRVGHAARTLHGRFADDATSADTATEEAARSLSRHGFASGRALTVTADAWAARAGTLLDACAHIANHLDRTVAAHRAEDTRIAADLSLSRVDSRLT
ncbi:hypothetical protein [Streptomyces sp. RFCAC02]|uniref:hypothetical protein n=1 Tax=Streptomyces sp. RFCAC02 TaxID=2499143 RepID=UPI00101FFDCB|nr:hypothetical protein [Streptomyces sp. RFCAC02]